MRVKLIALSIGILGTLSWALLHQISKREALPEKIKLYASYTPSSKELNEYVLVLEEQTHIHETDAYLNEEWKITMHHKIDLILRAIKENWGGIFVHSDSNTQSIPTQKEVIKALEKTDIVVQHTDAQESIFSGFIACRANKRTLQLWQTIKHMVDDQEDLHDQGYLNSVLTNNKIAKLRWEYLPAPTAQQNNPVA